MLTVRTVGRAKLSTGRPSRPDRPEQPVWSNVTDLELVLDANPGSVAPARAEVRRFATSRLEPEDVEAAAVVVSELVTNAQQASPNSRVMLHVSLVGELLRIEVVDGSSAHPSLPSAASVDAENGRGLLLVEALAKRWGSSKHRLGKCVWAELPVHPLPGSG